MNKLLLLLFTFIWLKPAPITIYMIGDSTMANKSANAVERCPIIHCVCASRISRRTSTGPGITSRLCPSLLMYFLLLVLICDKRNNKNYNLKTLVKDSHI